MEIPEVIAYRSTSIPESQWKSRPVDEWLKRWLDDCDYHESLVYEAIIKFCEEIRAAAPTPPAQEAGVRKVSGPEEVAELGAKAGDKVKRLLAPAQVEVTNTYVQPVPDKCDRITWRGRYYHLPIQPAQHGPDFPDGCDSEGFPGGCERFGHTPETCPNAPAQESGERFVRKSDGTIVFQGHKDATAFAEYQANKKLPPAQEDEPILRIYHHKGGVGIAGSINHLPDGTKLYTRPADNKLRKAAEALIEYCSGPMKPEIGRMIALTENLRAALEEGK